MANYPDSLFHQAVRCLSRLLTVACLILVTAHLQAAEVPTTSIPAGQAGAELAHGETVARAVCATCHLYPAPQLLDQAAWGLEILPKMHQMMGFVTIDYTHIPGGDLLQAQRPYPTKPIISEDDWMAVVRYYLANAPVRLPAAVRTIPIQTNTRFVTADSTGLKGTNSTITLVKIDPVEKRLYVADASSRSLNVLDARGRLLAVMGFAKPVVHLSLATNGMYATVIGSLYPSDAPEGQVVFIGKPGAPNAGMKVLLDKLHRPVHTLVKDMNGDGREDLVVCAYGNILGRFSWYENLGDGRYKEHILIDRPGAIASEAVDLDHDGREDLVVLMAQAWEGIYWLRNTGQGYETVPLIQWPPSWGSTSFQLVDFNGDGWLDVLASNGDNGDFGVIPAPQKPYHGVRVYLNDGHQKFTEAFFYPLNGAYKAMAADFQTNGRLDIAAISFFPDFQASPWESLIYLDNQGNNRWLPRKLPEAQRGRWFVMDVGDLDGNGWPDLVTGSFANGPGRVLKTDLEHWQAKPAPVMRWFGGQK